MAGEWISVQMQMQVANLPGAFAAGAVVAAVAGMAVVANGYARGGRLRYGQTDLFLAWTAVLVRTLACM